MAKNWIKKAIKKPGALHRELGVADPESNVLSLNQGLALKAHG